MPKQKKLFTVKNNDKKIDMNVDEALFNIFNHYHHYNKKQ